MASGFGQEDPGAIPDTAKDPPSPCGVGAHKIRGPCGRSLAVYHGCCLWKIFPSLTETYQN